MATIDPRPGQTAEPASPGPAHHRIPVTGLTCAGDAARLERRLRRVAGVEAVTINPVTGLAYVTYDPTRLRPEEIEEAVKPAW